MQYFKGELTSQDVIKLYRKLAMQYHPDRNHAADATKVMQQINAEFDLALKQAQRFEAQARYKATKERAKAEGWEYKKVYDVNEVDRISDLLREKIEAVINLEGVTIELCGMWIWVTGETRTVKEVLKATGYVWASKKMAWYYKGTESSGRGTYSLDAIREYYGSVKLKAEKAEKAENSSKPQFIA